MDIIRIEQKQNRKIFEHLQFIPMNPSRSKSTEDAELREEGIFYIQELKVYEQNQNAKKIV